MRIDLLKLCIGMMVMIGFGGFIPPAISGDGICREADLALSAEGGVRDGTGGQRLPPIGPMGFDCLADDRPSDGDQRRATLSRQTSDSILGSLLYSRVPGGLMPTGTPERAIFDSSLVACGLVCTNDGNPNDTVCRSEDGGSEVTSKRMTAGKNYEYFLVTVRSKTLALPEFADLAKVENGFGTLVTTFAASACQAFVP